MPKIIVAGGAGYIGSHMAKALIRAGYETVVFDNLNTGHRDLVPQKAVLVQGDLKNAADIARLFRDHRPEAVIHFAASSLVGESVQDPLKYYENNVAAAVCLLKEMLKADIKKIIFSSTAAVYGEPVQTPIAETHPLEPVNPYGRSKLTIEHMLQDLSKSHGLAYVALRYFNAAGADSEGETGERHSPETHLIPNILKAVKQGTSVSVFGNDYPTKDGTCVRDYIHVEDLCRAHLLALKALERPGVAESINLGIGDGFSVMEVIQAAEKVTGKKVKFQISPRRPGDPSTLIASNGKAKQVLGWEPQIGLEKIVRDAWNWEQKNGK